MSKLPKVVVIHLLEEVPLDDEPSFTTLATQLLEQKFLNPKYLAQVHQITYLIQYFLIHWSKYLKLDGELDYRSGPVAQRDHFE